MPKSLSVPSSSPRARGSAPARGAARHLARARRVFAVEIDALRGVGARLGDEFARSVELLLAVRGKVVVTGLGKSGHVAHKIASTLASTGTSAFFMHPAEAVHGDLGMLARDDAVIALSQSGEGDELRAVLLAAKRLGLPLVALTGAPDSTLAREASEIVSTAVAQEACPLGLAPTSSSTAALVVGDAFAVALLKARGFRREDFARFHPGGALGRRLLTRVDDVMRSGGDLPLVAPGTSVAKAIVEASSKGMGMAIVADRRGRCKGIFTDGDLRRALAGDDDPRARPVREVMTRSPVTIAPEALAVDAVALMESRRINQIPVTDGDRIVGALNMHDLLRHKVV